MIVFVFLVVLSVAACVPVDYIQKKREEKERNNILSEEPEIAIS
jgi:hypothetical protein